MITESIGIWIATIFLSLLFLFASSIKILGWLKPVFSQQMEMITRYGLNRQLFFLIGIVELFGAVAILWNGHWLGALGALAILTTSTGAIGCHLVFDRGKYIAPAIVTFALSALVFVHNWPNLRQVLPL